MNAPAPKTRTTSARQLLDTEAPAPIFAYAKIGRRARYSLTTAGLRVLAHERGRVSLTTAGREAIDAGPLPSEGGAK